MFGKTESMDISVAIAEGAQYEVLCQVSECFKCTLEEFNFVTCGQKDFNGIIDDPVSLCICNAMTGQRLVEYRAPEIGHPTHKPRLFLNNGIAIPADLLTVVDTAGDAIFQPGFQDTLSTPDNGVDMPERIIKIECDDADH